MGHADLVNRWPKHCSRCNRALGESDWRGLPLVSRAPLGINEDIELRRCACGDIVAVAVPASDASP